MTESWSVGQAREEHFAQDEVMSTVLLLNRKNEIRSYEKAPVVFNTFHLFICFSPYIWKELKLVSLVHLLEASREKYKWSTVFYFSRM